MPEYESRPERRDFSPPNPTETEANLGTKIHKANPPSNLLKQRGLSESPCGNDVAGQRSELGMSYLGGQKHSTQRTRSVRGCESEWYG